MGLYACNIRYARVHSRSRLYAVHGIESPDNEHFPSVRIIQKNNQLFKQIDASEGLTDDVLSAKFTNHKGVCAGVGNLLNLAYPDLWKYYFGERGGFRFTSSRFGGDFRLRGNHIYRYNTVPCRAYRSDILKEPLSLRRGSHACVHNCQYGVLERRS